jgi:hypothetical protein
MSLKAELETWANALNAYDRDDYDGALSLFQPIADSSKILFNMGIIYATLGEHEAAVEQFIAATGLDQYLAVAYFQCGVSNFLLGRYELALKDFDEAFLYLRGNQAINYEQLGLKFKLFSAEVLFNKGLSSIYLNKVQEGLIDMEEARRDKATEEHNVIDDAIADRGEGYTVFSIPVGVLYRPSEKKLKNSMPKDYMGKAKLVAASDAMDSYTTFSGATRLKAGITPTGIFIDKPPTDLNTFLNRSATAPAAPAKSDTSGSRSPGGLGRANTTLNVPSDARERIAGLSAGGPPSPLGRNASMARSRSQTGPIRGLSVRKPGGPGTGAGKPSPPLPPAKAQIDGKSDRLTEFYDDYLDSYSQDAGDAPPLVAPNPAPRDRIAAWAETNANPNYSLSRAYSRSAPPSAYAPSSSGGSSRRRLTRRQTSRQAPRVYEEEEEGYVSGEYEDGPFELIKIRVKLHYQNDVRGMALTPETPFEEFLDRVTQKFGKPMNGLGLRFKDEDGGMVTLQDESDYDLAIETARENSKGKPEGKLEIWCTDV